MDIFKLANEIASNMSNDEKNSMEEMDMDKMISHVTKNVFKMMNGLNKNQNELTESVDSENIKYLDSLFLFIMSTICSVFVGGLTIFLTFKCF